MKSQIFATLCGAMLTASAMADDFLPIVAPSEENAVEMSFDYYDQVGGHDVNDRTVKMVFAAEDSVYIYQIYGDISLNMNGWVGGRMIGDTIYIPTNQLIKKHKTHFPFVFAAATNYDEYEETFTEIPYLHLVKSPNEAGCYTLVDGESVIGKYYDEDDPESDYTIKAAISNILISPKEAGSSIDPIEGEKQYYTQVTQNYYSDFEEARTVTTLKNDESLWVKGGIRYLPDAWYKLNLAADGTASLPSYQFLGRYSAKRMLLMAQEESGDSYNNAQSIQVYKDEDDAYRTGIEGAYALTLGGSEVDKSIDYQLIPLDIKPVTPKAPSKLEVQWYSSYSKYLICTYFSPKDVDDNYLCTDSLYLRFYLDGEPYSFTTDTYKRFDNNYDELPIFYTDDYDTGCRPGYHMLFLCEAENSMTTIGAQFVYKVGDEELCSDVLTVDVATGEVVTAVNSLNSDAKTIQQTEYYSIAGHKVSPNYKGLKLRTTRYSDGSVKTDKVR